MKKYFCTYAGCKTLIDKRGYCPEHVDKKPLPFAGAARSKPLYSSSKWTALKSKLITADSCCCVCGTKEKLHLDHIVPHRGSEELFFNEDNLQVLCEACHRVKTAQEIGERRRNK